MNEITAFFDFLKYCLGNKGKMSRVIAGMNWGMISDCSIWRLPWMVCLWSCISFLVP